jgi:citrate lyase subunit beta/citryl-CoA lyase
MRKTFPIWRSMLFVPAHVEKFVAKAHERGADGYILDLEDSVPLAQKALARTLVATAAGMVTRSGAAALARVNQPWEVMTLDLEAVIGARVRAVVLPKVADGDMVRKAAARISDLETQRGLSQEHTLLIAQIEDVAALPRLDEIAASSPRLMGMILGSEDFSASAGMEPIPEALFWPNQQVAFACRRAGILPFGFPDSISDFNDIDKFRATIALAKNLGFVGAFCIHPNQIKVMNEGFTPSHAEVEHAQELLAAYEEALRDGRGAFQFKGKMVDPPIVMRAQELLARRGAF